MKLSIQLDDRSLFLVAQRTAKRAKKLREKMIKRVVEGRQFAVWELPYGDLEAVKQFSFDLASSFSPNILTDTLLFVNHGHSGVYQSFFVAGFPEEFFPHVQPILNNIVGLIRTWNIAPDFLVAMATQGIFTMELGVSPEKIERAYAGKIIQAP